MNQRTGVLDRLRGASRRPLRWFARWSVVLLALGFALAEEWVAVAVVYAAERISQEMSDG